MKKLVFIAIIASLAMAGCTQKEPEKKAGNSDKKATTENVELATCDINVGGIRFTSSKIIYYINQLVINIWYKYDFFLCNIP